VISQDTTETATFTAATTCTLTTSVTGVGNITPASGSTYPCGTQVPVQAFPGPQYVFGSWGGALSGNTNPTTLTLSSNATVSATFNQNTTNVTGDSRTVVEPQYPVVCSTLSAQQIDSNLQESSPDTVRVQAALNACSVGQAVEFSSSGVYNSFIIAPITLPPGVTMLVDPDVTIFGSIQYADYSCNSSAGWCTPLINVLPNAAPAPGSGIMGLGVIDGRGGITLNGKSTSWWGTGSDARPRLIYLGNNSTLAPADNFTMYQITLRNSPKFHVSGVGNNLTVWGIRTYAPPDSPNTDGIDPSGSNNITITKSYLSDGDDHISPKAGVAHVSNVTISNNHLYAGHGISVGSETNAGLNNMWVHDNAFDLGTNGFGASSYNAIRIKSDSSRGGEVHDVLYENTCVNWGGDTLVFDPYYSSSTGSLIPNFHDITIRNFRQMQYTSAKKSTLTGYNTSGTVYPLTLTLDNVVFPSGTTQNDFKAPSQVNNAQITLGPGPVSIATFLTADAGVPSNNVTVYNNISNSNAPLDCSTAFVYLTGDLTAPTNTATTGQPFTVTAVLQNVVSPLMAGTISYPQQNMPNGGTIQLLEGSNVVASAVVNGGRLTNITIPSMTAGTHVYTAQYLGDTNYSGTTPFGSSFTVTASDAAAPVANAQSVTVAYNTATPITLSATGSGTLTYSVVSNPVNGTLSGTAPNLTYTPNTSFIGADSFTFKANNGADSNVATVSITVSNAAPVATSQSVTVAYNTATPITLGATGSGTITYSVITNPAHGTLGGTLPNLIYTPTSGYAGADSFTFKANNGTDSNIATVSITVSNAAPVANNQSVTAAYNTAASITLTATGSGTLTYTVVSNPAHGTLSGTAPNLTYTPTSGYSGADSFTFKANNGTDSNVATVSITVSNAAPVANNQSVTAAYNTAASITLTATGNGTLTYSVVSNPAHGTLSGTAPNLTYTPTSGYSGADSFTFKANNGTDSNVGTVSITVTNAAPVANNQSVTVAYNTAKQITLTAAGSGTLTYTVVSNPAHGTLSGTAPNLTYTPTSGYSGVDSFTFKANNGTDSNVATVSITVSNAPPVAPVANNQSVTVSYNTATAISLSATGTGTLTYSVISNPAHGTLSGTAPNLTYTPTSGYSGADSFTFKANNGSDSNVATVSITVNPGISWTPVTGGSTSATVTAGQPASFNLQFAGWTGATGTVTFSCAGAPTNGTCTVTPGTATLSGTTPIQISVLVTTGTTTASLKEAPAPLSGHGKGLPAMALAGLLGFAFSLRRRRAVVRLLHALILCIALSAVYFVTGCGGSSSTSQGTVSKSTPGTYPITVTATAGTVTQNANLTLIVQ
jgi:polygalacturonase